MCDALFSRTQQRVLALLFGQPDRSFYTTEIIGLVGAGSGTVQRLLGRLADAGLASVERLGNQKHYRANPDAPIFGELRDLVAKTLGPIEVVREAVAQLEGRLRLALVYGSVASRQDGAGSDIDLLVVSDVLTLEELFTALQPAERQLGRPIHPTIYTAEEFAERRARADSFVARLLAGKFTTLKGGDDVLLGAR